MTNAWMGMAAALACASLTASAATYYVAQENPRAADTNRGTEARPWKSINRSLQALKPGDTVFIKKGVYREAIELRAKPQDGKPAFPSGTGYDAMITFAAHPRDRGAVVIKGSDVVTGWKPFKDGVWMQADWTNYTQQVFCDGRLLQQIGGVLLPAPEALNPTGSNVNDLVAGSFFCDETNRALYVRLADGGDPNGHVMEVSVRECLFSIEPDFIRVTGLTLTHSTTKTWGTIFWLAGSHAVLEDCAATYSTFSGLATSHLSKYHTVRRSRFNHNGDTGITGSGVGHRFVDCETSSNNYRRISAGWHAGGVKLIPFCRDIVFDGHLAAYNVESPGIWFDWGNSQCTVLNSVCHHNGCGIMYEVSTRGVFLNNLCYDNDGRGIYISNSRDCEILFNTCIRNGTSGIVVIGVERQGGPFNAGSTTNLAACNNLVWGNLLMDNCHPDLCPKVPDGRGEPWSTRAALIMPEERPGNANNVSDYNLIWNSDGRAVTFWKGWHVEQFPDLAAWQKATGNDRHTKLAAPLFADLAGRDLRPASNSPALRFVRPSMTAHFDKAGALRKSDDGALNTAGAYEQ